VRYGKIIHVERPDEISEAARLRRQLQLAKGALSDAHMEPALEKAFLSVACEQLDQTVEGLKRSTVASHVPGDRVPPGDERGSFV
jgi:hypothetical protein